MPNILVSLRDGRSQTQKQAFADDVTAAAVKHLGVVERQVIVTFAEKPDGSFFVGGKPLKPVS